MSLKNKITKHILFLIAIILFITLIIFLFMIPTKKSRDLQNLSQLPYDSIFISSYSLENYSAETFKAYRGLNTYICEYSYKTIPELTSYLDTIFNSNNVIDTVYIEIDPSLLFKKYNNYEIKPRKGLDDLSSYITQYPSVTFEIILPTPSIMHWAALDETKLNQTLLFYQYTITYLDQYSNTLCFFAGNEEWLYLNPANYDSDYVPNSLVSERLICFVFSRQISINLYNCEEKLLDFKKIVLQEQQTFSQYPNLSHKTVVFFGDSILGLQNGSYSVPGVINGLTNANIYNYAIGGTTACDLDPTTDTDNSFTDQLNKFLNRADFYTRDNTQFPYDEVKPQDMVFVINYGFNDYLENFSTADYEQTLRAGIARISAAYPEAQIIIMTPYENIYHNGGIASVNEQGLNVQQYADVVIKIAGDMDITLLDIPSNLDINESNNSFYFDGGCHYNENGRYYLAKCIISIINIE